MLCDSMARDDDGRRKPKGTLALDISQLDLDGDDPPPKAGRRKSEGGSSGRGGSGRGGGGRGSGGRGTSGRGGSGRGDRHPDDEPRRGGGGAKGTAALDISQMDLDDHMPAWGASRPGGSGAAWGGDEPARSGGSSKPRGGRQVEDWRDDEPPDSYRDPRSEGASRPTRPSAGITDEELEQASAAAAKGDDATRAIGQFDMGAEPPRPSARLTVKAGDTGQPVHTLDKDTIKVGREVDNDVVLLDAQASRYHFELRRRGSSFELKDMESGNGTLVNGHGVSRVTLTEGAVIRVGDTELMFDLVAPGSARPKGGLSSAATEAAPAPPAPVAARAATSEETEGPEEDEDSGFPLPIGMIIALGAVGLLGFVFVSLLLVFMLTGDGDKPKKGSKSIAISTSGAAGDGKVADELPPNVLVGPALSRADKAFGAGKWFTARRHLLVAKYVAPGNKRAKEFMGRVDRALQTQDTPALRVSFDPERPKRGKPLTVRVRLEQPVRELRASFMGERFLLRPSTSVPREYVGELTLPKRVKKGEKELDVELTDLQDTKFEFARRIRVK